MKSHVKKTLFFQVSFFDSSPVFLSSKYGDTGNTALHVACKYSTFNIVLYLLEQNAPLNVQNSAGYTPLFLAAESGRKEISQVSHNEIFGSVILRLLSYV